MADIRKGDLIKATRTDGSGESFTGVVRSVRDGDVQTKWFGAWGSGWDVEVLERPLPPVEDELLDKAIKVYREESGLSRFTYTSSELLRDYGPGFRAVINTVREFDRSKETSK